MTSTELDHVQESSLELLPPAQPPSIAAQKMLLAHAEMMDTAYKLASAMVKTTMVPTRFLRKPEDATAAILYGAELGLNPIQSLQRVIPIHGMPSLEARTMVALLKSRGYRIRTREQSDTSVTVEGWDLNGDQFESTWTIDRAKQAGYVPEPISDNSLKRPGVVEDWVYVTKTWDGKSKNSVLGNMKYITDPQAMLKAKCQAEVCRDMAPDILLGISYAREELESERWDEPASAPAESTASDPVTVEEILGTAETTPDEELARAEPETQPADPSQPQPEAEPAPVADEAPPIAEAAQPEPEPEVATAKEKTRIRTALERRLFKLLAKGDVDNSNREDRLIIYRAIIDRSEPINSTDDLDDTQVAAICDQLFKWDKAGELGQKITDILNEATLAADEEQQQTENNEGE
jgi:hypothetical protein